MRKRRIILLALAIALLAAALYAVFRGPVEPTYEGSPLSDWIRIHHIGNQKENQRAAEAIRAIGTNALPFLLAWLRDFEAPVWKIKLASAAEALGVKINSDWAEATSQRAGCAGSALVALGSAATSAIPEIIRLANDTNDYNRAHYAMDILGSLGKQGFPPLLALLTNENKFLRYYAADAIPEQGSNAGPAIPLLVQYLSYDTMAERAALSLGILALEPNLVIPALSNNLHHSQGDIRAAAVRALGWFTNNPGPARLALRSTLTDPDAKVREEATNALLRIAPEVLTNPVPR